MSSQTLIKGKRLHVRASSNQKALIERAAEARHLNVSQFVLQASLTAAAKVVQEEEASNKYQHAPEVIWVNTEEYDLLAKKLEEPAQENSELRKLLKGAPVWNG